MRHGTYATCRQVQDTVYGIMRQGTYATCRQLLLFFKSNITIYDKYTIYCCHQTNESLSNWNFFTRLHLIYMHVVPTNVVPLIPYY